MIPEITHKQPVKQVLPVYSLLDHWRDMEPKETSLIETRQIIRNQETEQLSKTYKELPANDALKFRVENFRVVCPGCLTKDRQVPDLFSGIIAIMLELDPIRFQEIYSLSARDPRVLMRFANATRTRIHIWQRTEHAPQNNEEFKLYFDIAVSYLRNRYKLTDKELSLVNANPVTRYFLESDPDVYDNHYPELIPFTVIRHLDESVVKQKIETSTQACSSEENLSGEQVASNGQPTSVIKEIPPVHSPINKSSFDQLKSDLNEELRQVKEKVEDQPKANDGAIVDEDDQHEPVVTLERKVIDLCTNSAALDLWTWQYNHKENEWIIDGIYRTGIFSLLERQQFAKRYRPDGTNIFLIKGDSVIEPVIDTRLRDSVKDYIQSDQAEVSVGELKATYEIRLELFNRQQHLIINPKGLEGLATHERILLQDTPTVSYTPYKNGIIEVTAEEIIIRPYTILVDSCVWKSQVLDRVFDQQAKGDASHFARFIVNISNGEPDRIRAARTALGFLCHHNCNPSEGQAIICYDEEITDARKPEGGTGKGLFGNAIRQIKPVAVIDGKKFDSNDRFCFQQVNQDTAVVWIDDPVVNHPKAERRFSLERFFSTLTEGWSIEKKHEHAFRIPAKEGPKLLISSNVVMPNEGSSNVRRQFILEFSNHYKKQIRLGNEKPIQAEHGCVFFSEDWDVAEWQRFDQYMIGCIQEYLRDGLQPYKLRSADQNRLRQTAGEDFYEWVTKYQIHGLVANQEYSRDILWQDYKAYVGLPDNTPVTRGFTNNITQYAKSRGLKYERGDTQRNITFTLTPQSCI